MQASDPEFGGRVSTIVRKCVPSSDRADRDQVTRSPLEHRGQEGAGDEEWSAEIDRDHLVEEFGLHLREGSQLEVPCSIDDDIRRRDRKSTRLNSSHVAISYA